MQRGRRRTRRSCHRIQLPSPVPTRCLASGSLHDEYKAHVDQSRPIIVLQYYWPGDIAINGIIIWYSSCYIGGEKYKWRWFLRSLAVDLQTSLYILALFVLFKNIVLTLEVHTLSRFQNIICSRLNIYLFKSLYISMFIIIHSNIIWKKDLEKTRF